MASLLNPRLAKNIKKDPDVFHHENPREGASEFFSLAASFLRFWCRILFLLLRKFFRKISIFSRAFLRRDFFIYLQPLFDNPGLHRFSSRKFLRKNLRKARPNY